MRNKRDSYVHYGTILANLNCKVLDHPKSHYSFYLLKQTDFFHIRSYFEKNARILMHTQQGCSRMHIREQKAIEGPTRITEGAVQQEILQM